MSSSRRPLLFWILPLVGMGLLLAWPAKGWSQSIIDTISVGPNDALAINQETNKIYVAGTAHPGPYFVTVIGGTTDSTMPIQTNCSQVLAVVAVNEVTNKIYVVCDNGILAIDGVTNSQTPISDQNASGPVALAVDPSTNKIYVANCGSNNVSVIDGANNHITTVTDPNGSCPYAVAINPVTNKIYVLNQGSATVIDGITNSTTSITIPEPNNAGFQRSIAVNVVTNKIYVATGNNIGVIDGATNAFATLPVPAVALAVNSKTNKIYAATATNISVIDGAKNSTTTITDSFGPAAVAVNETTNTVYVANDGSTLNSFPGGWSSVTVINGSTNSTTTIIDPKEHYGSIQGVEVAVDPVTNRIYVANNDGSVSVIDGAGVPTTHTLAVGLANWYGGTDTANLALQNSGLAITSKPSSIDCWAGTSSTPALVCIASFVSGADVQLTASAVAPGWTALFLTSPCSGANSCDLTMSSDQLVIATVSNVVPNVHGLPEATAINTLNGVGLYLGTETKQSSSSVAAGDVISTDPPAGQPVTRGSNVNLVISTGIGSSGAGGSSSGGGGGGGSIESLTLAALLSSLMAKLLSARQHHRRLRRCPCRGASHASFTAACTWHSSPRATASGKSGSG